jgi:hypothetical protein
LVERREQGVDVLGVVGGAGRLVAPAPVDVDDLPAVGLVAHRDVLAERDVGVVLDGDLVRVVDDGEVAELLVARERRGLGATPSMRSPSEARTHTWWSKTLSPALASGSNSPALAALRHRHADRRGQPGPERAGGDLDTLGVVHLGVARGQRPPRAQRLEVLELQAVAAQEQLDVLGERGVAAGEHEAVTPQPRGIGRVVVHDVLVEQVRRRGQAHRGARVSVATFCTASAASSLAVSTARTSRSVHPAFFATGAARSLLRASVGVEVLLAGLLVTGASFAKTVHTAGRVVGQPSVWARPRFSVLPGGRLESPDTLPHLL